MKKRKHWHRTPSGRWVPAHHPGTDHTQNPLAPALTPLDKPNGPTSARLTVHPLPGLLTLSEKYAAELENGRKLRDRLE